MIIFVLSLPAPFLFRYTQNGLLNMLDRNRRIKDMPQKFQHFKGKFDVIICLEERVYDQVRIILTDFGGGIIARKTLVACISR